MKSLKNSRKEFTSSWYSYFSLLKSIFIGVFLFVGYSPTLNAQDNEFMRSPWWIGVAGGTNFNLYHGSFPHQLNSETTVSSGFQSGKGNGQFAFPVLEFHKPDKKWGFILQAGYESRKGTFDQALTTKLAYFTIEPSVRLNLLKSPFYIFTGPRFAVNVDKRFTYQQGGGTLDNMKSSVLSMQMGAGYDITLTAKSRNNQAILAPFFAFHPYFGQSPRSTDSWNVTTLRFGIALKFGKSHQYAVPRQIAVPVSIAVEPDAGYLLHQPPKDSVKHVDNEVPNLKNYVFYDLRSSELTKRYNNPDRKQLKYLKKEMIGFSGNENLSDSTLSQMTADDNFLNILGKQMANDPSSTITLVGSSENGARYGQQMAESMKTFLVGVFQIDNSRIKAKGQKKLKIHSGKSRDKSDLALLLEKDRQVLIESNSGSLQTAFRGNSETNLKPLGLKVVHEPDVDGYITFKTDGTDENFASWTLKITDGNGKMQDFGPYTGKSARIPKRTILGDNTLGEYEITMFGQLNSGQIVRKDTSVYFRIWPLVNPEKYTRFSISYEFNNSKSIKVFNQYLKDVVAPKISNGANVVIYGHSNVVEDHDFDLKLFLSRANDARDIIQNALSKLGITDVQIEVYGLGDDQIVMPFEKVNPEPKYYNRTLIIDVVPGRR